MNPVRRLYHALPGPPAARVAAIVVIAAVLLVGLLFFYDWVGSTFLDTGGSIG